jgi:hypothetical protein
MLKDDITFKGKHNLNKSTHLKLKTLNNLNGKWFQPNYYPKKITTGIQKKESVIMFWNLKLIN